MSTIADYLWAPKDHEEMEIIISKGDEKTEDEAKKLLDLTIHPEIKAVWESLKEQIVKGLKNISYAEPIERDDNPHLCKDLIDASCAGPETRLLFHDAAYMDGTYAIISEWIEQACPEYKWVSSPIGEIHFAKK